MALPTDVRNLRKYLLAAQRELDSIKLREEFRMDVDGISDGLNRAWGWVEEYTWSLQHDAPACGYQGFGSGDNPKDNGCLLAKGHDGPCSRSGTSVVDSEDDSRPASEAEGSVNERGTPWFFSM